MRALVVHDNVPSAVALARAVADGLSDACAVEVVAAPDAAPRVEAAVDLLVVATAPGRDEARRWLTTADIGGVGSVTALGTRARLRPPAPGSAAAPTLWRLRHRGVRVAAPATTFVVDRAGTPVEGELGRARRWGRTLAAATALVCRSQHRPVPARERLGTTAALTA